MVNSTKKYDTRYHDTILVLGIIKKYYSTKVLFSKNGRVLTTRIYFDIPETVTYIYIKKVQLL